MGMPSSYNTCLDQYMKEALLEAKKALSRDEVPIGAIVVDSEGAIIGRGHNLVENYNQQSRHAEVIAIEHACTTINDWRLLGCSLYVTLEPCEMCMSLTELSRVAVVIYGSASPLFGFRLDKEGKIPLYKKHTPKIISGICKEEAATLLTEFFKEKRK